MKKSFSLIELMLAVSILSIGIVAVLRSFLSVVSGLDTTSNLITAMRFLESRVDELELEAFQKGGVEASEKEEEMKVGVRKAKWKQEIAVVEFEEEEELEEEREKIVINEFKLTASWQEANRDKNAVLAAYFIEKEEESE